MGIFCQINLCKPADGRYTYQPGSIISGAIRYCIDEEYQFTSITVSLKGRGDLYLEDLTARSDTRLTDKYSNDEIYVDLDIVIYTNESGEPYPVGQNDTQFSFQLPYNIPGSLNYDKKTVNYVVKCNVKYILRIKFQRPTIFRLNKQYKKEINVISVQTPRLTTEPLVYGEKKSLLQLKSLFSINKGTINLKAVMCNSVLRPGECVKIDVEINNDTNKAIKGVRFKLSEVDQYTSVDGHVFKDYTEVENAEYRYDAIPSREIGKFTAKFIVPEDCASIDHCKFLSRDYSVMTVVKLPGLPGNLPLEIPFQVIKTLSISYNDENYFSTNDTPCDPPTYWEAMAEDKNDYSGNKGLKLG